jgi:hypothetical protein
MRRWSDSSLLPINNPCYGATSIAYSFDGTLFTASNSLGAQVWRVSDGAPLTTISQLAKATAIAVSNDGTVVAANKGLGGSYGSLYISSPAGVSLTGSDPIVGGVAVSPDGTLTAAVYWQASGSTFHPHAYFDGIWNVSSGQRVVASAAGVGINDVTPPVVFSRDGTLVAFGFGGDQGTPKVLHSSDGSSAGSLGLDPMAFSDDDSVILAGYPDFSGGLDLIQLSNGSQVGAVVFSSTTSTALAGGFGGALTPLAVVKTSSSSAPLQLITNNSQTGSVPID